MGERADYMTPHLRVALEIVKAAANPLRVEEIVRQSELSTEEALYWVVEFASLLVGLIANVEGATKEATLAKIAGMLDKRESDRDPSA